MKNTHGGHIEKEDGMSDVYDGQPELNPLAGVMPDGQKMVIGFVDAIHGEDGKEVDFRLTRHELKAVARLWIKEHLDFNAFWRLYGSTGSSDCRLDAYAGKRLQVIRRVLGDEEVEHLATEVEREHWGRDAVSGRQVFDELDVETR